MDPKPPKPPKTSFLKVDLACGFILSISSLPAAISTPESL